MAELSERAKLAAAKYDAMADVMGSNWEDAKPKMLKNWAVGVGEFHGITVGERSKALYDAKVAPVTGRYFSASVRGKGTKLMEAAKASLMR